MKQPQLYLPFYGSFTIHENDFVEWLPNDNLKRSAKQQFDMNKEHGHFEDKKLIGVWVINEQ